MRVAAPNDAILTGGAFIHPEAGGPVPRNDRPAVFRIVSTDAVRVRSTYEASVQVTTREQIRDIIGWKGLQIFVSPHPKRVQQDRRVCFHLTIAIVVAAQSLGNGGELVAVVGVVAGAPVHLFPSAQPSIPEITHC
jgi:hypothetical protein